jgi:hypothetical protein
MRLIKAQSTSVRNIKANGIRYDINQIVQLGGEQAVVVPMGNTASRPLFPANGMIRYNTETERSAEKPMARSYARHANS